MRLPGESLARDGILGRWRWLFVLECLAATRTFIVGEVVTGVAFGLAFRLIAGFGHLGLVASRLLVLKLDALGGQVNGTATVRACNLC